MKPTYEQLEKENKELRAQVHTFCNNTAKDLDSLKSKHQDLQNAVDSIIKLELEFVSCRAKEEWMADWAVAFSNLVKVSGKNNDDTNKERDEAKATVAEMRDDISIWDVQMGDKWHYAYRIPDSQLDKSTPMPAHEFPEATQQDVDRLMDNPIINDMKSKSADGEDDKYRRHK